jgi:hypothetical protein
MHSFHRSRGRIVFEVLCALAISASCVGAWMQTGAWALLPAAFALLLYGVVRAFDGLRSKRAPAKEPRLADLADDNQGDLPFSQGAGVSLAVTGQQLEPEKIEEAEPVEPIAPRAHGGRKANAARKGGARRAKSPKKEQVTVFALPEEVEVTAPLTAEEPAHFPLTPLFEPEPFVRQQRTVFGRKAG